MLDILDPLLRPLSRLLIAQGVIFPDFANRMKSHYVQAANRKLKGENAKLTDSRLSAMTGLQRRDIVRLKEGTPKPKQRQNYLARLVATWQTDPAFGGRNLPKNGPNSFETLARQTHQDVHPRTMFDELLAAGTVAHDAETGEVKLLATSFLPLAGSEDQIDYLARNTGDHLSAATENVAEGAAHFERAAHYTNLTETQVETLTRFFEREQMALLEKISQKAAEMKRQETGPCRIRVGAYFYHTKEPTE